MTTTLDITNQDITLYDEYRVDIMKEINATFTPEEQDLYVLNFATHINYNSETDFIVDFDQAYKMIGYDRKSNAKVMLENNFKKDRDYIIKSASECAEAEPKDKNTKDVHNKEIILLTINCFKSFCLYTHTDKSKQIHDYYVKLENIFNKIIKNQNIKFKEQLRDSQKQLQDIDVKLQDSQKQLQDTQKQVEIVLSQKEQILINNFAKKPIVYLGSVNKNIAKPGRTNDIETRLKDLKRDLGPNYTFIHVYESKHSVEIERRLFKNKIMIDARFSKEYNGHTYTELFMLDSTLTIEYIDKLVREIKTEMEASDNSKDIINQNIKRFSCSGCGYESGTKDHIKRHIESKTLHKSSTTLLHIIDTPTISCKYCHKLIKTITAINHIEEHLKICSKKFL